VLPGISPQRYQSSLNSVESVSAYYQSWFEDSQPFGQWGMAIKTSTGRRCSDQPQ